MGDFGLGYGMSKGVGLVPAQSVDFEGCASKRLNLRAAGFKETASVQSSNEIGLRTTHNIL